SSVCLVNAGLSSPDHPITPSAHQFVSAATSGDPDYDEALDRLLSQWMRNVSGLSAGMVRPRWQKEQPPLLP
ncbi:hypothetical protein ACEWJ8_26200, partial [Escherichia coli]